MPSALLADRGVVRISGEDARAFLQGIVTADMDGVAEGRSRFAALLSPQGKILFDFHVHAAPGGELLLDAPRALAGDLTRRLGFYRLRAKVACEDASDALAVVAAWEAEVPAGLAAVAAPDPRLAELGARLVVPAHEAARVVAALGEAGADEYQARRIALGVPEGGRDFAYGDAFPHEACMDALHGVDFGKGCFVGQEVVSRMEHRGTARTRIVPVAYAGEAPEAGAEVRAGERVVGRTGSAAAGRGLAALRLDRVAEALAEGLTLAAGGVALSPVQPRWAPFRVPGAAEPAA